MVMEFRNIPVEDTCCFGRVRITRTHLLVIYILGGLICVASLIVSILVLVKIQSYRDSK